MVQVRFFDTDLQKLRELFGTTIGVNSAVRVIIRAYLRQVEAIANAQIDAAENAEEQRAAQRDVLRAYQATLATSTAFDVVA